MINRGNEKLDKAQPKGRNSPEDFLEEGAEQVGNPEAEHVRGQQQGPAGSQSSAGEGDGV